MSSALLSKPCIRELSRSLATTESVSMSVVKTKTLIVPLNPFFLKVRSAFKEAFYSGPASLRSLKTKRYWYSKLKGSKFKLSTETIEADAIPASRSRLAIISDYEYYKSRF